MLLNLTKQTFLFVIILLLFSCANYPIIGQNESKPIQQNETIVNSEVLYNGIRLPKVWPPKTENPQDANPMSVPYLDNPPKVIPINIGRQLFVDDFLIEKTNLTRVYHRPEKHEGNPVFSPTLDFEKASETNYKDVVYLGHGGVFYDNKDAVFKMFYTAGWRGGLALVTSKDLINWKRPKLNLYIKNLILPKGPLYAGGDNAIWLDLNANDSLQRYKAIFERLVDSGWEKYYKKKSEGPTHTLHTSPNGKIWSQGMPTGRASDYTSFFYNPFRNIWVFSIKKNTDRGRSRFYSESKDFISGADWNDSVYWLNADKLDKPDPNIGDEAQLYSLNAVAYESILLGEFYIHLGPHNKIADKGNFPKITEIKIGYSRDGFHWSRPDRNPFIEATRKKGDWDRAYLHGTNGVLLVMKDKLWFPYTGFSGIAADGTEGMYSGASIGMATLRRDGFVSIESKKNDGYLTTRPVTFSGKYLFVNVDCSEGELYIEVLNSANKVIKKSKTIKTDNTIYNVQFTDNQDLAKYQGQVVKFRFKLKKGKIYSFWVSPDKNGASYGYLGGGNPNAEGNLDIRGKDGY